MAFYLSKNASPPVFHPISTFPRSCLPLSSLSISSMYLFSLIFTPFHFFHHISTSPRIGNQRQKSLRLTFLALASPLDTVITDTTVTELFRQTSGNQFTFRLAGQRIALMQSFDGFHRLTMHGHSEI